MELDQLPVPPTTLDLDNTEIKKELHRVLHSIQQSAGYGIYVCEAFKDPQQHQLNSYWGEVADEALGIQTMHRLIGSGPAPLSENACCLLHRLSRVFERLSRRIDRLVLVQQAGPGSGAPPPARVP